MLSLLNADSIEEMRHIASNNKEALKVVENLEEIMTDEKVSLAYNIEKENRKLEQTGFEKGYDEGKAEGRAEGRAEGKAEGILEVAKKMLEKNYSYEEISIMTGLSKDELNNMK